MSEDVRLNEYTKTEWWDICRKAVPGLTEEEFDNAWEVAVRIKAERERQMGLN